MFIEQKTWEKAGTSTKNLLFRATFTPADPMALIGKEGHTYFGGNNSDFTRINHVKLSLVAE